MHVCSIFLGIQVHSAIQSHYGEEAIRIKFSDYLQRFVRLTATYEQEMYGQTLIGYSRENTPNSDEALGLGGVGLADEAALQRELNFYNSRMEGWIGTISYKNYQAVVDWQPLLVNCP